jgi:hypothetical protein
MSSKQWVSLLVFAFGIVIITTSLFLETLGQYTGFWLVTGVGFAVIAVSIVLDGHVGNSNPQITQRPIPPSRLSQMLVASTISILKITRRK